MPRKTRAQGRPGTRVIPLGWEDGHRVVAEKTMTATVALRHPGTTQEWSTELQENVETPLAAYATTRCRVQALATQAPAVVAAEDTETVAKYLLTVPDGLASLEGDLATVSDAGDSQLDGRTLRVEQVIRGSLRFERDLICTLTD